MRSDRQIRLQKGARCQVHHVLHAPVSLSLGSLEAVNDNPGEEDLPVVSQYVEQTALHQISCRFPPLLNNCIHPMLGRSYRTRQTSTSYRSID